MSEPSPQWLRLRAPFDEAAREAARSPASVVPAAAQKALAVLDLGAGTGANFRYLAPRLGCDQHWLIVDRSARLLACATTETGRWARDRGWSVETRPDGYAVRSGQYLWTAASERLDFADGLSGLDLGRFGLVTASALMDLVSWPWFDALATQCRAASAALAIALTYDGRMTWRPIDADDATVLSWFNAHQRGIKSFGPAMGPDAPRRMVQGLRALNYRVEHRRSDWRIGGADIAMQQAMVGWIADACLDLKPDEAQRTRAWAERRRNLAADGGGALIVGHVDLVATPPPA